MFSTEALPPPPPLHRRFQPFHLLQSLPSFSLILSQPVFILFPKQSITAALSSCCDHLQPITIIKFTEHHSPNSPSPCSAVTCKTINHKSTINNQHHPQHNRHIHHQLTTHNNRQFNSLYKNHPSIEFQFLYAIAAAHNNHKFTFNSSSHGHTTVMGLQVARSTLSLGWSAHSSQPPHPLPFSSAAVYSWHPKRDHTFSLHTRAAWASLSAVRLHAGDPSSSAAPSSIDQGSEECSGSGDEVTEVEE